MELHTYCYYCSSEFGKKQKAIAEITGHSDSLLSITIPHECRVYFTVSDNNVYKLKCGRGHEFYYIYPEQKFEILFRSAVNAYTNKYLRDAISSAAVGLERFYEFCTKAMCLANNITTELFNSSWKDVSNQSERQLGSFIYLYLITTKQKAPILSNDLVSIRNGVIHKGKFPSKEDSYKYLNAVLNNMYTVLNELDKYIHDSIERIYQEVNKDLVNEYCNKGLYTSSVRFNTIVGTVVEGNRPETLDDKIAIVEKTKKSEKAFMESIIKREVDRSQSKAQPVRHGNSLLLRAKADNYDNLQLYVDAVDELYGPIGVHYFSAYDVSMGFGTKEFIPDEIFIKLAKSLDVEFSYAQRSI